MEKLIIFVIILPLVLSVVFYNKLITLRNYTQEAFSTMDVYLKKRWDLIPNILTVAKSYMEHEKQVLEKITKLRTQNYDFLSNKEKIAINKKIAVGLSNILVSVENYPELKSNEIFNRLMTELSNTEDDIANARKYYNASVREYNTALQLFPTAIIANIFKFKKEKSFTIRVEERENVKVEF